VVKPIERLTLAGLHELVVDYGVGLAFEEKLHARADFAGSVTGHLFLVAGASMANSVD